MTTDAEWLACEDPAPMLEYGGNRASHRKLRPFGCGCCRCVPGWLAEERVTGAVDLAERFADGLPTFASDGGR